MGTNRLAPYLSIHLSLEVRRVNGTREKGCILTMLNCGEEFAALQNRWCV